VAATIYHLPFGRHPAGSSQWQMENGKWQMANAVGETESML
jgi:hypothetical protein